MLKTISTYVVAFFLFPLIDYLWLARIMSKFYLGELGSLARAEGGQFSPLLLPAFFVYVCLALGVGFFVLNEPESLAKVLLRGALLGFIVYGVYDFTNMSLVDGWSWKLTLVDIAWGTFLCALVSSITYMVTKNIQ